MGDHAHRIRDVDADAPSTVDRGRLDVYRCEDLYSRMCARANPPEGPVLTELAGSHVLLPAERKFADVADIGPYLAKVLAASADRWPVSIPPVRVRLRRGAAGAHWEAPDTIAIPDTAEMRCEHVALHELAHHIDFHIRAEPAPTHGRPFREVLCQLHTVAAGPVGGWALSVLFDLHLGTAPAISDRRK